MRSTLAGRLYSHLASEQDATGPGQSPAQDVFFLTFGVTGKVPDKCICPLGKVLTYKNLIYLLNFPICSYQRRPSSVKLYFILVRVGPLFNFMYEKHVVFTLNILQSLVIYKIFYQNKKISHLFQIKKKNPDQIQNFLTFS